MKQFTLKMRKHKFNVTIPDHDSHVRKLTIEDRNGNLHILCTGEIVE